MREERRIGDPYRESRLSAAIKKRYICEHVKDGALTAARVDTPYGIIGACQRCYDVKSWERIDAKYVEV